ncbi:MAG: efflux RND transporter periplasmic adaptor subunit [Elusimicrobiaceae bacterium]|nr:efflux RND transporter periplasmic adaptor subunit [Elusimicrobiaceae bacterium]
MKRTGSIILVGVLLMNVGCHKKEAAAPQAAVVNAVSVLQQDYPWTMEYPAQIAGSLDVQIRAQVGGILQARLYDEGEFVEQGTQLFQIDDKEYMVALEKARGTLAQAQAEVKRNKRTFQRMKTLRAENAVSQQDYDNALSAYETAQANVQVAQAGVNNAEINLGYTKVTAPISGIAGKENQTVGSLISAVGESGLLTTMVQIDPLYINFSMPGSQFEKLTQGYRDGTISVGNADNPQKLEEMNYRETPAEEVSIYVEVLLSNGKIYPRRGKLIFFDSSENTQTSSIAIKAAIANPALTRELIPGQFVRVRLVGAVFKNAVLVPASAVLVSPNGLTAYVIKEDNTVELRPVEGELQNDMYIISSGLKGGERVINGGLVKIRPGMLVAPTMQEFTISQPQEKVEQPSDDGRDMATLEQAIEEATAPNTQALPDTSIPPAADTTPTADMPNPAAQTPAASTPATGK